MDQYLFQKCSSHCPMIFNLSPFEIYFWWHDQSKWSFQDYESLVQFGVLEHQNCDSYYYSFKLIWWLIVDIGSNSSLFDSRHWNYFVFCFSQLKQNLKSFVEKGIPSMDKSRCWFRSSEVISDCTRYWSFQCIEGEQLRGRRCFQSTIFFQLQKIITNCTRIQKIINQSGLMRLPFTFWKMF